jgi:hypothetical protein
MKSSIRLIPDDSLCNPVGFGFFGFPLWKKGMKGDLPVRFVHPQRSLL